MKKIFTLLTAITIFTAVFISCDKHRDDNNYEITSVDKLKIDSVQINSATMTVNSVQSIRTYSNYSSGCDHFYDYNYIKNDAFTRTVTAYHYNANEVCTQATYVGYNQFNFQPTSVGTYTFKFWNGVDTSGNSLWITKTITVN